MQKGDLVTPKKIFTYKMNEYCCTKFNIYRNVVIWDDCYRQLMFHVKPLHRDGTEISISFYFLSILQVIHFRSLYTKHHSIRFWQSKIEMLNTETAILSILYDRRIRIN